MASNLVLASHNTKKIEELRAILRPMGITLTSLAEYPGAVSPEENGTTFEENALIKARAAVALTGLSAVADDSGLMVDALGGEPGVRSARYAGKQSTDAENNYRLLARLTGVPHSRRTARFVSVVALVSSSGEEVVFRGETDGIILEEARGENGFGYDPLFLSNDLGVSFGEAASADKHRISHRGRALEKLKEYLCTRREQ